MPLQNNPLTDGPANSFAPESFPWQLPGAVTAMHLDKETSSRNFLRTRLERLNNPRMINFLQTNSADYISKLHCKVLALNGAKDIKVVPDQNLAGIDKFCTGAVTDHGRLAG